MTTKQELRNQIETLLEELREMELQRDSVCGQFTALRVKVFQLVKQRDQYQVVLQKIIKQLETTTAKRPSIQEARKVLGEWGFSDG